MNIAMSATRSAIAGTGAMLLNGQERASEIIGCSLPHLIPAYHRRPWDCRQVSVVQRPR
jgi:hypothetical protein